MKYIRRVKWDKIEPDPGILQRYLSDKSFPRVLNSDHPLWMILLMVIDLIIFIPSATSNIDGRKSTMETWLYLYSSEMKHYFIIGTEDVELLQQDELYEE